MLIGYIAALAYGVLAIIAALVLSSQVDSPLATALAFASAGLAYLYQVAQINDNKEIGALMLLSIGALLASVFVSLWSAI
jgi:hypothetical protein